MLASELDSITWKLMTPTRDLESAFKSWARGEINETQVSEQFVKLGNEFIAARSKLAHGGVPVKDLINVPQELRLILEEALALDCAPSVADQFDPQIRQVMATLFRQLKSKQIQMQQQTAHAHALQAGNPQSNIPKAGHGVSQPNFSHSVQHPVKHPLRHPHAAAPTHAPKNTPNHVPPRTHVPSQSVPYTTATSAPVPQGHACSQSFGNPGRAPSAAAVARARRPRERTVSQDDAMSQLQRHGALERQASKRYSTRQLSRLIQGSPLELPTSVFHRSFSTPDYTDSSVVQERHLSPPETPEQSVHRRSPNRRPIRPRSRNPSASEVDNDGVLSSSSALSSTSLASPGHAQTLAPAPSLTLGSTHTPVSESGNAPVSSPRSGPGSEPGGASSSTVGVRLTSTPSSPVVPAAEEFPVFLRVGNKIRKAKLSRPPSIAAIRLQYVEVCEYIHLGNESFPKITMQDPDTHIEFEITEASVSDVTEGSLLTLKVKTEEETRIDAELKEIKESIKELVSRMVPAKTGQSSKSVGVGSNGPTATSGRSYLSPVMTSDGRFEIEKPKKVVEETKEDKKDDKKSDKKEEKPVKSKVVVISTGERSMTSIKKNLDDTTQELLSRMDNLSDIIDAHRESVASHGIKLSKIEIEKVKRSLSSWRDDFETKEQFIDIEGSNWKRAWGNELNTIIEEQEWLKTTTQLYKDLRSDLIQSTETFDLVCQASEAIRSSGARVLPPMAPPIKPGEEKQASDAMLFEIRGLELDSDKRAEAAARAERLHKGRQAAKVDKFAFELNTYVEDSQLKKRAGGFEEVERRMREREERNLRLAEESEIEGRRIAEELKKQRKAKRLAEKSGQVEETPEQGVESNVEHSVEQNVERTVVQNDEHAVEPNVEESTEHTNEEVERVPLSNESEVVEPESLYVTAPEPSEQASVPLSPPADHYPERAISPEPQTHTEPTHTSPITPVEEPMERPATSARAPSNATAPRSMRSLTEVPRATPVPQIAMPTDSDDDFVDVN